MIGKTGTEIKWVTLCVAEEEKSGPKYMYIMWKKEKKEKGPSNRSVKSKEIDYRWTLHVIRISNLRYLKRMKT